MTNTENLTVTGRHTISVGTFPPVNPRQASRWDAVHEAIIAADPLEAEGWVTVAGLGVVDCRSLRSSIEYQTRQPNGVVVEVVQQRHPIDRTVTLWARIKP